MCVCALLHYQRVRTFVASWWTANLLIPGGSDTQHLCLIQLLQVARPAHGQDSSQE